MATETLDPRQDNDVEDDASAEELEALYNLPSAEEKNPINADDLDSHFSLAAAKEPVYEEPGNQPGGDSKEQSKSGEKNHSWYRPNADKAEDRDSLANAESQGGDSANKESLYKRGHESEHDLSGWDRLRQNLFVNNRRKTIAGGGLIGTIIAVIFGFSVIQGPLQLVHLGQILQRSFARNESSIKIRNRGLLRYAKTGNVEETRLSKLGSTIYNQTLSQLDEQGIKFDTNSRGVADTMTIDTSKNDNYKDLARADRKAAIIEDFSISDTSIIRETSPGVFTINLKTGTLAGIDFAKATAKTAIGSLGNGKIQSGLALRYVKRAWDLPGLFSPYEKARSALQNKFSTSSAERQKAQQLEEERLTSEINTRVNTPETLLDKAKLKEAFNDSLTNFLIATATACAIRSAANAAVDLNRAMIVVPAAVQSADKIAIGSQIQKGSNFDLSQLDATTSDLTDPQTGKTVWSGQALQALSGSTDPGGTDLLPKYREAFSGDTTASEIRSYVEFKAPIFGWNITGAACSGAGQAAQAILGLAVALFNLPDGEAGAVGYLAAIKGLATSAIAFGGAMYAIEHFGAQLIADKAIVPAVLSGPQGGNLLAYGSRELANISARSMGGTAIAGSEKTILTESDRQEEQKEWVAEGPAKRLLDINDDRSVASTLIDNVNLNPKNLVASMGRLFTNFGSMLSSALGAVIPKALAANTPYDWQFPQYGITNDVTENAQYEDPYDNADQISQVLNATCLNSDGTVKSDKLGCIIPTVTKCFGVDINKDANGLWQVVANGDVNPSNDDYPTDTCNGTSDFWTRMRLFVFDSRLIDTVACYQNDADSCNNLAMAGQ